VAEPDSAAAAPPESDPRTPSRAWPARQGAPPGLFKLRRTPWTPYPRRPPPLAPLPANPSSSSPPPPSNPAAVVLPPPRNRSGAAQGGEQRARATRCRPRAPDRPCDLARVRAPRRHVDRPRHRVSARAAALDRPACSRASRRCHPRLKPWPETLDQGPRRRVRRRPPPLAAAGLCFPAARRLRVSVAAGSRSSGQI
jgi:hypothetical protein